MVLKLRVCVIATSILLHKRTSKSRKTTPPLNPQQPTSETFAENVKRAHVQAAIWHASTDQYPPNIDPTLYRWKQDEINKVPTPIGIQLRP